MQPKTYVSNEQHKKHRFVKALKYRIGREILYMWKCDVCGDVVTKVEKITNKAVT